jgi:hypothetical protein
VESESQAANLTMRNENDMTRMHDESAIPLNGNSSSVAATAADVATNDAPRQQQQQHQRVDVNAGRVLMRSFLLSIFNSMLVRLTKREKKPELVQLYC